MATSKNRPAAPAAVRIGKQLFESGQQCQKRLYLDHHDPIAEAPSDARRAMSAAGQRLLQLARGAFPRGIEVAGKTLTEAAHQTKELLQGDATTVLFGAAFQAEDSEVQTDIVVRQKGGLLDLYEVKSGTRVSTRYLQDLSLQVATIERAGHQVRAVFVLHLDKTYKHPGGDEYEASKLLRSADVSERVRRQVERTQDRVASFQRQLRDDSALQQPTGTFCTHPFRCPHLDRCQKDEPEFPLRQLPDLTPSLERQLHEEGIADLDHIDVQRPGLTFRQRRLLQALRSKTTILETFVGEELQTVERPLHFVALHGFTEALPRFAGQKPWHTTPCAWAAESSYEDGRVERAAFVHADKGDPRAEFVQTLGKHLETGGLVVCWCGDDLATIRELLDSLPEQKQATRAVLARPHLDLRRLLESGMFDARLIGELSLPAVADLLELPGRESDLPIRDAEAMFTAIQKASAPRVRQATKDKIAADIRGWVEWEARMLRAIFRHLSGESVAAEPSPPAVSKAVSKRKQLPPT